MLTWCQRNDLIWFENTKDNKEQSLIPFLLQISLSLFYLLQNLMSKELFGEASKYRNKKQEARRKLNWKNWKGNLLILQMGVWKTLPLPHWGGGQGDESIALSPTGFRKKQNPLKIVISCKVVNNKDIQKILFFLFSKFSEIMLKDVRTRRKWRTRNIEISKYFHLISYKYSKIFWNLNEIKY